MHADRKPRSGGKALRQGWCVMAVVAVLGAAGPVGAQSVDDVQLLTPRDYQRLSPPARDAYDKGVKALDHVDPVTAIQMFDQASQADPAAVDLAFLTARMGYLRGRMVYGADAAKYYDLAQKALERVGKVPDLTPLVKRRYETQLKMVQEERKKLGVRDARRKVVGEAFCKIYAVQTYKSAAEAVTQTLEGKSEAGKPAAKKPMKSTGPVFGPSPIRPQGTAPGMAPGMVPGMIPPAVAPPQQRPEVQS